MAKPSKSDRPISYEVGAEPQSVGEVGQPIKGCIVAKRGEMEGWGQWVDSQFLDDLCNYANAVAGGVKAHFGHPNLFGNAGIGYVVGHYSNYRRDGNLVRADFAPMEAARLSPVFPRDPLTYITAMAKSNAKDFGNSLSFNNDWKAELEFMAAHGAKAVRNDEGDIEDLDPTEFKSPDSDNANNCYHVRLASLVGTDIVDRAATGEGFFSAAGGPAGIFNDQTMPYIAGRTEDAPAGYDANVLKAARKTMAGYLARAKLTLATVEKEEIAMPTEAEVQAQKAQAAKDAQTALAGKLTEFKAAFPKDAEFAVQCAAEGLSLVEAKAKYSEKLLAKLDEAGKAITDLTNANAALAGSTLGGQAPVSHAGDGGVRPLVEAVSSPMGRFVKYDFPEYGAIKGFMDAKLKEHAAQVAAHTYGPEQAFKEVQDEHPNEWKAMVAKSRAIGTAAMTAFGG